MKTLKSALIIALLLISGTVYSQSGWIKVTDSVPRLWLESIQMTSANTGYACGMYSYVGGDKNERHITAVNLGALLKTTNGGLNWQRFDDSTKNIDAVSFIDNLTGYYIGWNGSSQYHGYIFKTTDGGASWIRKDSVQNGNFFFIKFLNANTGVIAGKYGQILHTTNGGVNWTDKTVMNLWHEPQFVWLLNTDTWFVGDGLRIAKTTNQGLNWTVNDSVPAGSLHFFNGTTGISGGGDGFIYKTTNAGENWIKITGTSLGWSQNITFTDNNTGYYARYGYYNIYKTTNGGYNWFELSVNNYDMLYSLSFINNFTGYAAGTNGRIFRTTNGGSVFVSNISNEVPDKFELGQNYPNPFNQFSIIDFKFQMKSNIELKVYDAEGREVRTLVNETLAPGMYQVRFDGSGLASGMYYYSMTVDGRQTAVKKMVMIK